MSPTIAASLGCSAAFRNSPLQTATSPDVKIDCRKEFWEAIRLGDFDTADNGFSGDYPSPDLFPAEAAGEGHQHHPQGEGPGMRQRHCHAL